MSQLTFYVDLGGREMAGTMIEAFARRRGIDPGVIHSYAGALQNVLSWYSRGWDLYMNSPADADTREQAYAMAVEAVERAGRWSASLALHRDDQINGYMDAYERRALKLTSQASPV